MIRRLDGGDGSLHLHHPHLFLIEVSHGARKHRPVGLQCPLDGDSIADLQVGQGQAAPEAGIRAGGDGEPRHHEAGRGDGVDGPPQDDLIEVRGEQQIDEAREHLPALESSNDGDDLVHLEGGERNGRPAGDHAGGVVHVDLEAGDGDAARADGVDGADEGDLVVRTDEGDSLAADPQRDLHGLLRNQPGDVQRRVDALGLKTQVGASRGEPGQGELPACIRPGCALRTDDRDAQRLPAHGG